MSSGAHAGLGELAMVPLEALADQVTCWGDPEHPDLARGSLQTSLTAVVLLGQVCHWLPRNASGSAL